MTQDDASASQDILFQMGSTSKSVAAAIILKLEPSGELVIWKDFGDDIDEITQLG